jgi:hypothetical protein
VQVFCVLTANDGKPYIIILFSSQGGAEDRRVGAMHEWLLVNDDEVEITDIFFVRQMHVD